MQPKTNAAKTTITRDVAELEKDTGNLYQSVVILSRRANQIASRLKEELHAKMEEYAVSGENLEEVYENPQQIELSKLYERMPKPTALAIQEMLEGKIYWRHSDEAPMDATPQPATPA
jgi:DNA-directed RNA polymerase subunit K/omega